MRVLLLDEADRVLLVRFRDGDRYWWWSPGGGVEPGETDAATARREIRELSSTVATVSLREFPIGFSCTDTYHRFPALNPV